MPARKSTTRRTLLLLITLLTAGVVAAEAETIATPEPVVETDEVEALAEDLASNIALGEESEQEIPPPVLPVLSPTEFPSIQLFRMVGDEESQKIPPP